MSSADNLYKQFVPRLGPTKRWAWPGSKLFDTVITPELFFEKMSLKKSTDDKKHEKFIKHAKSLTVMNPSTNRKVNLGLIVGDWTHGILFVGLCHVLIRRRYIGQLYSDDVTWVTFWAWLGNFFNTLKQC